ncbi:MAG: GNAT family N-acetyltransferase [Actinomycetales bacterium]|nr:GNAT family N-acetyltransferase [Actinomycetales bacterium]
MTAELRSAVVRSAPLRELAPETLYAILRLRQDVFVVEQEAAYPDIDGRELEPDAVLMWVEEAGTVVATVRVLHEPGRVVRIGRVATAAAARGAGHAATLMRAALDATTGPVVLDAQAQLEGWYGRFGFRVSGEPFAEDGIPHLPMRLER